MCACRWLLPIAVWHATPGKRCALVGSVGWPFRFKPLLLFIFTSFPYPLTLLFTSYCISTYILVLRFLYFLYIYIFFCFGKIVVCLFLPFIDPLELLCPGDCTLLCPKLFACASSLHVTLLHMSNIRCVYIIVNCCCIVMLHVLVVLNVCLLSIYLSMYICLSMCVFSCCCYYMLYCFCYYEIFSFNSLAPTTTEPFAVGIIVVGVGM